jgi:N-acetylglucosaminyldiphosphoundecaprenol N-acetyl-beta-D-mannosaminyltransferase
MTDTVAIPVSASHTANLELLPDLSVAGASDTPPESPRVDVLGVGISTVTPQSAIEALAGWIQRRERTYVCVTGVHGVMECQRDESLRTIHNASGLTVPDGMPMVWSCHRAGVDWVQRVYGPDLMRAVCARAPAAGWRVFLYGSVPDVVEPLSARLTCDCPGLQLVGRLCPPFRSLTPEERAETIAQINAAAPDIVWVGLSTPKQERWMHDFRADLEAPVLVGVGAAFDFVAGIKRQAPPWLQDAGLEWLFRMATEPRRLWKRYAKNNPAFLTAIAQRPPRLMAPGPALRAGAPPPAIAR